LIVLSNLEDGQVFLGFWNDLKQTKSLRFQNVRLWLLMCLTLHYIVSYLFSCETFTQVDYRYIFIIFLFQQICARTLSNSFPKSQSIRRYRHINLFLMGNFHNLHIIIHTIRRLLGKASTIFVEKWQRQDKLLHLMHNRIIADSNDTYFQSIWKLKTTCPATSISTVHKTNKNNTSIIVFYSRIQESKRCKTKYR
jgi:hypothetical protein